MGKKGNKTPTGRELDVLEAVANNHGNSLSVSFTLDIKRSAAQRHLLNLRKGGYISVGGFGATVYSERFGYKSEYLYNLTAEGRKIMEKERGE